MPVKYIRPDNLITDRKTTKLVKRKKFIQEDEYEMKISAIKELLDELDLENFQIDENIKNNYEIFSKLRDIKVDTRAKVREAVQKNMRDREIAMYKNYRREMLTIPSIDYKIKNPRLKKVIRRADTIRHLQRVANR